MVIPFNDIGGLVIEPKEMMKAMAFSSNDIKFLSITYFGA